MCLCNLGVASASVAIDTVPNDNNQQSNEFMRNTFYRTASLGFGGAAQATFGQGFKQAFGGQGQETPQQNEDKEQIISGA